MLVAFSIALISKGQAGIGTLVRPGDVAWKEDYSDPGYARNHGVSQSRRNSPRRDVSIILIFGESLHAALLSFST